MPGERSSLAIGSRYFKPWHTGLRRQPPSRPTLPVDGIVQCEREGITALVPKLLTSNSNAEGRFDKRDFIYDAKRDEYRCPAGQRAIWRMTTVEEGLTLHRYWPSACPKCPIKRQSTPSDFRRITRWGHEGVLDAMQARLERAPELARTRRQTVEHIFRLEEFQQPRLIQFKCSPKKGHRFDG